MNCPFSVWREILAARSVAVVGTAKNTGKTTTVNHLLRTAADEGLTPGLTSIGRDGEGRDVLYGTPKPVVRLPAGALVATTARASLRVLESTGCRTPLGEVVIAVAGEEGPVEVAGPGTARELGFVVRRLVSLGARPVLVDGAFDRVAGAVSTGAVILATGAAVDRDPARAMEVTRTRVEQFTLPPPEPALRKAVAGVWLVGEDGFRRSLAPSALGPEPLLADLPGWARAVVVGGAVGERFLAGYCRALSGRPDLALVIRNAACLFAGPEAWAEVRSLGGRVYVLEPLNLIAVTVNPVSPLGYRFKADFQAGLAAALHPLPVGDWGQG